MQARTWKTKTKAILVLLVVSFVFVSLVLVPAAIACPLFVNENADYLTNIQVTPLNRQLDYLTDENHKAMPVFTMASNQAYSFQIDFDVKDASTTVFLKILRCGNESFPELYRVVLPPPKLVTGRNSIVVDLPAPEETGMNEASLYMVRTVGVAGHTGSEDWHSPFEDGLFAGRTPEELNWDDFEVAYQVTAKVGGEYHNPLLKTLL